MPTLSKLPDYLREHNYTSPKEYSRSPMRWAVGQSQFEWLAQRKEQQALFNSYMASRRQGRPPWFDVYPIERLADQAISHDDAVFVVDVGGNQGHDLLRFREKHPEIPGRLVLQDLPKVVPAPPGKGIEPMAYSFLDPQPVKGISIPLYPFPQSCWNNHANEGGAGARAYYFRAIFHDWPDYICQKILLNTVSAMDEEYSRIIIVDFVLPNTNTPLMQASLDIQMMSIGSGIERSERQWRALLHEAGLEITGIWNHSPAMESVIEAVPRRSIAD